MLLKKNLKDLNVFIFVNYYMMLLEDVDFDVDYVDFEDKNF